MTRSFQNIGCGDNFYRHANFYNFTTEKHYKKHQERSKKLARYFERHLLIAWLISFIAAPLAVLGAVILVSAAIGFLLLTVL